VSDGDRGATDVPESTLTRIVDAGPVVATSISMCGAMVIRQLAARRFCVAIGNAWPADLIIGGAPKGRRLCSYFKVAAAIAIEGSQPKVSRRLPPRTARPTAH